MIVLLDQMEELFSDATIPNESREQLFEALEVLACSGAVWVLATVRSDFYHHCQTLPALMRMKEGAGWFDLLPPPADALSRVITGPALQAGLRFERRGEQCLSDAILREAVEHRELLPLVEHLLLELCQRRSEDGTLTFAEFERLEGVEGALRQRCEETYGGLSSEAQASLEAVVSELVTLSGDGQETVVRRTVPLDQLAPDSARRELLDKMVAARLFTMSSGPDGCSVVSVAHEALLRVWPRAAQLIESKREYLRLRARVEQSQQNWEHRDEHNALLLPLGPPLDEARQLLREAPRLVSASTRRYIDLSSVFRDQQAQQARTEALIRSLMTAEPSQLPDIVQELDTNMEFAAPLLAPLLALDANNVDEKRTQLHARLALVSGDPSLIEPLVEDLLTSKFPYVLPIRWRLRPFAAGMTDDLRGVLRDCAAESHRRFRAALALADYVPEPEADCWSEPDLKYVAEQLVSANPEFQPLLRDALRPLHRQLLPELERIFADSQASAAQRLSVANAFADYAASDTPRLSQLLTLATPEQFDVLYPLVAASSSPATVEQLARIVATPPPDALGALDRVPFGQQRANAAVALLRLGERESVLPVFQATDDPEALTQFIFRCRPRGVAALPLLDCLQMASDGLHGVPQYTRYALLLALGEFRLDEVPAPRRDELIRQLADWYAHDPSSAVHGAAGWLLRHWGQADIARDIDQTELPYAPGREWFTQAVTVRQSGAPEGLAPQTFYYTFIVFPPGTYPIGSMADEPERNKDEFRHAVTLTRPFALLDRQITFQELIAFSPIYAGIMSEYDANPTDAGYGLDWYDSVEFCRWLGEQAGFTDSDQPYAAANWGPREIRPVDISRRGFRLPTDAEWEIAARAGARSAYGYGSDVSLLARFEWFRDNSGKCVHPPKELRPGLRGLFDVHGNLCEWCHDWYEKFGTAAVTDPLGPVEGSYRVSRGGSWNLTAESCRSAHRFWDSPSLRSNYRGFRVTCVPSGQ